jgi:iron complex outermembrane receptor protein
VATNLREELIDQNLTPITFSIGFEHAIASYLQLKGVLSKNFRIPTFDDLYWKGWGNPNLKNESGFNQDLGFRFSKGIENINFQYELTGFSNMVSNWILWEPSLTGSDIWTPENVSKVWARGIENDFDISVHMNSIVVKSSLSYSYTRSTKVKADIANDPAVNKQLIYVPKHKGLATINVIYKGFTLYYGQSYTGSRYTMKDNSKYIRPYSLGNISLTKNFKYRQKLLSASIQINNIGNTVYQVMEWYPMPLRNYQLNIKLNFK